MSRRLTDEQRAALQGYLDACLAAWSLAPADSAMESPARRACGVISRARG